MAIEPDFLNLRLLISVTWVTTFYLWDTAVSLQLIYWH